MESSVPLKEQRVVCVP